MQDTRPVLVATDLGENADAVIRQADALARRRGVALVVGHVLPEMFGIHPLFPHINLPEAFSLASVERRAGESVARRTAAVTGRTQDGFDVRIASGSPHHRILEMAEEVAAGLIVIGAHGGELEKMLGNVTRQVVRHAASDVWVARASFADNPGPVTVATDFSAFARAAIDGAKVESTRLNRDLVLLYSQDFVPHRYAAPFADTPLPSPGDMERVHRELSRMLDEEARRIDARPLLKDGPAAEAIVAAVKELHSPLLVVGTHGRTGIGRLALGSVAEKVVEKADCSVLVVRMPR